jgi:hypothetical protein
MAQADSVPTRLCAQITGINDNSSTNPTSSISAPVFAELAKYVSRIEGRVCGEALGSDLSSIARSAS